MDSTGKVQQLKPHPESQGPWTGIKATCLTPGQRSSSVSRWVSLLKGRPGSRVLAPACPTGNVQGVPVAVEAERDTAADEDHLPPIPVADKSFHAPGRQGTGGDKVVLC